ncbi:transcriptional regulator opi1 [Emydomyces testavorans]|uniref:Transcriptional regulator opi1 n=1 Tax=Emydomyces testavorans TaxID=2070801 RepID=A0AAF0DCI7_9EURO|nr:transcriptional regulator opi1 [Emydomyces testavorans]
MDVDSMCNDDRSTRATSVLSMDDIEAAQALEGLRSEFAHASPSSRRNTCLSSSTFTASEPPQPEPLLSLLTSSHPLLSSAINGSMSVYSSSKSYSPRFKYGAEFIERNIGTPVVNTVGSVGRRTGVEGGLRWVLQRRENSDANANSRNTSSRNQNVDAMDIEKGLVEPRLTHTRRSSGLSSIETLPPYDTLSSPSYDEMTAPESKMAHTQPRQNQTWQSRLMISTSGLGVAMSEESLRSLTYCLKWLQWANTRLGNSIITLKRVLEEWDESRQQQRPGDTSNPTSRPRSPTTVSQQIQQVKQDVLQTLKQVVDVVSRYTGGALPENARNLVRRHLTSLPQRFRLASSYTDQRADASDSPSDMTSTHANRVLVLAEEGLDMMAQVSKVVNDTLVSAESWCEKLRRPKPSATAASPQEGPEPPAPQRLDIKQRFAEQTNFRDVEMTGMDEKA